MVVDAVAIQDLAIEVVRGSGAVVGLVHVDIVNGAVALAASPCAGELLRPVRVVDRAAELAARRVAEAQRAEDLTTFPQASRHAHRPERSVSLPLGPFGRDALEDVRRNDRTDRVHGSSPSVRRPGQVVDVHLVVDVRHRADHGAAGASRPRARRACWKVCPVSISVHAGLLAAGFATVGRRAPGRSRPSGRHSRSPIRAIEGSSATLHRGSCPQAPEGALPCRATASSSAIAETTRPGSPAGSTTGSSAASAATACSWTSTRSRQATSSPPTHSVLSSPSTNVGQLSDFPLPPLRRKIRGLVGGGLVVDGGLGRRRIRAGDSGVEPTAFRSCLAGSQLRPVTGRRSMVRVSGARLGPTRGAARMRGDRDYVVVARWSSSGQGARTMTGQRARAGSGRRGP